MLHMVPWEGKTSKKVLQISPHAYLVLFIQPNTLLCELLYLTEQVSLEHILGNRLKTNT